MSKFDISSAPAVTDSVSAEAFVCWCCRSIGPGFHPDTLFTDYVEGGDGSPTFGEADAAMLQARMDAAFGLLDDPSSIALNEFERMS